jgi:hypothetical protein
MAETVARERADRTGPPASDARAAVRPTAAAARPRLPPGHPPDPTAALRAAGEPLRPPWRPPAWSVRCPTVDASRADPAGPENPGAPPGAIRPGPPAGRSREPSPGGTLEQLLPAGSDGLPAPGARDSGGSVRPTTTNAVTGDRPSPFLGPRVRRVRSCRLVSPLSGPYRTDHWCYIYVHRCVQ